MRERNLGVVDTELSQGLGKLLPALRATFAAFAVFAMLVPLAAPARAADPVVAAAGDIACASSKVGTDTCHQMATSDLLVDAGLAKVLALGDNQYDSGSLSDYNAYYNPSWGRVKSITRPVLGNHENSGSGYFDYFGSLAGPRPNGYYSYDIGGWHLIALNSNCDRVACAAGSAQEQWLRSDLAAHPDSCTLAYFHHARFSSGHDGDNVFMQDIWQALYDAEADVVLAGHSHNYERLAPMDASGNRDSVRGIRSFVVGTGGAFFTGISNIRPNSEVHQSNTYGVLKLTLHAGGYDWQFVPEAGRTFTDSGSGNCHRSGSGASGIGAGVISEGGSKTLSYFADAAQTNDVTVTLLGSTYTITDRGVSTIGDADGSGGCSVIGNRATCPASGVSLIRVDTRDRNDNVLVSAGTDSVLLGGDGADSLTSGGGKDQLEGWTGNDTLDAGGGDDLLNGGPGDDSMAGGAGTDTADYSNSATAVAVNLSLTTAQATGGSGTDTLATLENLEGTPGNDQLTGNPSINVLNGHSGADNISSRDSVRDTVNCGSGADVATTDTLDSVNSDCNTVDNGVPPNTTITSSPPSKTEATTATFKFSSSETPSTFQCSLDGAAWSVCTTPASYSGLAPGPHTFDVRALDQYGNMDATPARATWTVTAAPLASFEYSPIGPYVDDNVVFRSSSTALGAGNQILTHEWDLDGNGTFEINTLASSTASRRYPTPTTITIRLRVTDANGKTATAASALTISLRPPPLPSPPPGSPLNPSGPFGQIGADELGPKLALGGSKSQRLVRGALSFRVRCDEQCTVTAVAKLKIGRASGLFSSRNVKHVLAAGVDKKLRLKFSAKSLSGIRRALAQERRVFAKLTVHSSDSAGNLSSARRTIRLER
jgi:Ca2+-binding RTX toxin-like protein